MIEVDTHGERGRFVLPESILCVEADLGRLLENLILLLALMMRRAMRCVSRYAYQNAIEVEVVRDNHVGVENRSLN